MESRLTTLNTITLLIVTAISWYLFHAIPKISLKYANDHDTLWQSNMAMEIPELNGGLES